jgi:hypothetical protein
VLCFLQFVALLSFSTCSRGCIVGIVCVAVSYKAPAGVTHTRVRLDRVEQPSKLAQLMAQFAAEDGIQAAQPREVCYKYCAWEFDFNSLDHLVWFARKQWPTLFVQPYKCTLTAGLTQTQGVYRGTPQVP